ncbi:MAG TPA: TatD family hydrolase, partial [Chloroflexota bacterium]|nr:TatD family hydrolase [Chloroflexota bacterium]
MLLADTHAHLDAPAFLDDIDAVLARAQESGVERILTVGSDLATSERAVEIAQRFEIVFAAVGIHPHEVGRFDAEAEAVRMLLEETGVVAIGEVGLDYHWHPETGEAQREAFRTQLAWARERHLPVSVHNRDADDDLLTALGGSDTVVVLHCFSGNLALAESALDSGYYVSFAGNVTFPRAHELREVAARVPGNRLLTET